MLMTIENTYLQLTVDTLGAQMMHIRSSDGVEYLWQGDPRYWKNRAPVLFPLVGRQTEDSYSLKGRKYPMGLHGFAKSCEFRTAEQSETGLVLELVSDASTKEQYPFDFCFRVGYALEKNKIAISYSVENLSRETMPFGLGAHPGFRVPLEEGERFEDYCLEFSQTCQPDRVGFSPALFLGGPDTAYPLVEGRKIPLDHSLFDTDAIILKNMARQVTLSSRVSHRAITLSYPDMPYLGLWHAPKTEAPYVCIEPWMSLPARQDIVEEITCKSDLMMLEPEKIFHTAWSIAID